MDGRNPVRHRAFIQRLLAVCAAACLVIACGCSSASSTTSATQTAVPAASASTSDGETHLEVMSDIHVSDTSSSQHLEAALDDIAARDAGATLCIDGDGVDGGTESQYARLQGILGDHGFSTQDGNVFVAIGNHECADKDYAADWQRFETSWGYASGYHDSVVGQVRLIALCSDQEPSEWTKASYSPAELAWLDSLLEADEAQGLFTVVLCHQPLTDTVYGSQTGQRWANQIDDNDALRAVLNRHRDVVFITGHSHLDLTTSGCIYRSVDGSGPLFVRDGAIVSVRESTGRGGDAQGLAIDVARGVVTIEARDFTDGKCVWRETFFRTAA